MARIFILAASRLESDPVARLLGVSRWNSKSEAGPISAGPNQIEFFITGIGPKQSRENAKRILSGGPHQPVANERDRPDAVLVIGLCGGLTASMAEMTIVTYSSCMSATNGGIPFRCPSPISGHITALLSAQKMQCEPVIGITSPRIAVTRDDKLDLARTGAQVVDMESYEILSAAHQINIPAVVVRIVSDSLDRKLPDLNPALNTDGSVSIVKALGAMLGSPLLTARAYAVNKRAARHLANALKVVLSSNLPSDQ